MTQVVCPCGCGETFPSVGSRGRPRRYFSPGCSLRVNNYMGGVRAGKRDLQLELLNPFQGRRHSDKTRRLLSEKASVPKPYLRGDRNGMARRTGSANPNYKTGSSPERQRLYASAEWRDAQRVVRARDGHRCVRCDAAKQGRRSLHIHHIKSWAGHPELRFDPDNLITLCAPCHHDEHRKEVRHQ